jgi:riboflavin synthase|tara:strand:- start:164 stop:778 length:615 start_codon:yes stop_codon:yes gene_type:complete
MFSGIVSVKSKVSKVKKYEDYLSLEISTPKGFDKNLKRGASISVNGVCLTSKDNGSKTLKFDVIEETISKTNLQNISKGDTVNLERSIKASTEIGGHLMSGHVHFTANIIKIVDKKNTKDIQISLVRKYSDYVMEKGYIGINGCSLTIGKVTKTNFYIHLIPETLNITNLDQLSKGDQVNIEIDQNTITVVNTVKKTLAAQISS